MHFCKTVCGTMKGYHLSMYGKFCEHYLLFCLEQVALIGRWLLGGLSKKIILLQGDLIQYVSLYR